MDVIKLKGIYKAYGTHVIFENFDYSFHENTFYAIVGDSGKGKSTLLNMIGLLEEVDQGSISLFAYDIHSIKDKQSRLLMKDYIGYLFQSYALVDEWSVEKNMEIAIKLHKLKDQATCISNALQRVGLEGYEKKLINTLSGGEQQRVALARLLVKPCKLILADEPTGNLDQKNKEIVFSLLKELQQEGKTILMVTHDPILAARCDIVIDLNHTNETNFIK